MFCRRTEIVLLNKEAAGHEEGRLFYFFFDGWRLGCI